MGGDYFNIFLHHLKIYLDGQEYHEKFAPLLDANMFALERYKIREKGFNDFMKALMLEKYLDYGLSCFKKIRLKNFIEPNLYI